MRRRVLLCLALITMSACNGDRIGTPIEATTKPSNDISDATHTGAGLASNPDFFFLPPMVKQPGTDLPWNAGAFNPNLRPTVEICDFGPAVLTLPAGSICTGVTSSYATAVSITDEHYKVNWSVPETATKFYRITVKVGNIRLGYADVESGASGASLKNVDTQDFVPLVDGRTLPIKFRIERYALCANPATGGCTSASADIATTPLTVSTGTPTADGSGISTTQGISIPVQGGDSKPLTVTLASCPNLNPRVLDLPTFGDCVRVTFDPVRKLTFPATVFICSVGVGAPLFLGLTEDQERLVSIHRYDEGGVAALPHADACKPGTPGGIASLNPSIGAMLANLGRGQFKRAARQAVALLAPKPLYASMFIDLGGGGFTDDNSDFQFALPAKMEIVASTNNQTAPAGTTLSPTVLVTDLSGAAVAGAVVHFYTSDPAVTSGTAVTTGTNGLATTPWTIVEGANTLPASGRGIASPSTNGPRESFDPFQPISTSPPSSGVPVIVGTGSVQFTATGFTRAGVLIFGPSLFTPTTTAKPENEQTLAQTDGLAVTVWDAATWSTKTTADFARFRAIIFADPDCAVDPSRLVTANNNKAVWSPVVSGPVVIIGTDPVFHQANHSEAKTLMRNAIGYAVSNPSATGMYASLSCYYYAGSSTTPTQVDFLSGVGGFYVVGQSGFGESVAITQPTHPVMTGLSNAGLSNWGNSAHEAFPTFTSYPANFVPLATINKPSTSENLAYIIARP